MYPNASAYILIFSLIVVATASASKIVLLAFPYAVSRVALTASSEILTLVLNLTFSLSLSLVAV